MTPCPRQTPPRLLLVEDDATTQGFFRVVLEAMPARLDVAGSLAEALPLARQARHALWLVDANLPDGSGIQLLRQLRDHHPDTPALAHTADTDPATRRSLLDAGFTEVLIKPLPGAALLDAVRRQLGDTAAEAPPAGTMTLPDWDEDAALRALNGQQAHVVALRDLFLGELPQTRAAIDNALQRHDDATLRAHLHRLQASCGFVGAGRLAEAARGLHAQPESANAQQDFFAAVTSLLHYPPPAAQPR